MRPIIAMPRLSRELFRMYMTSKYVNSLWRAGAKVRWIDMEKLDEQMELLLECDGLLLPGGADVDPRRYGQEKSPQCGKLDENRDAGEFKMLDAFLHTGKPILGICRGEQLMNVYFGGTLHQDIKGIQKCNHDVVKQKNWGNHHVRLIPETGLAQILGQETLRVNSLHHQAADTVAPCLTVAAVSEDGFIEALEKQDHPFCIGVQWHPEHMAFFNATQRKIFTAFVGACRSAESKDVAKR